MSTRRDQSQWEDPYEGSELCDSERDPGDEDVMYAEVHPVSSLYAATRAQERAARQDVYSAQNSIVRPGVSPPRSSAVSATSFPGAYNETESSGRSFRFHPLDSQVQAQSFPGVGVSYGTAPPRVAQTGTRVGVGVMLDSSSSDLQDSLQGSFSFDSSVQQRNRGRRESSAATAELNLPRPKELEPRSPYHQAIEPPMPLPKRSRRYMKDAVRMPDICVGSYPGQTNPQDKLQVQCDSCKSNFLVPKSCVLLKCPQCKHVSSAMPAVANGPSMRTYEYGFAT